MPFNKCNPHQERQIVGILLGLFAAALILGSCLMVLLSRRRKAATTFDLLERSDPYKRTSNFKGFVEVVGCLGYMLDIASDLYFVRINLRSQNPLVRTLSILSIFNVGTQFLHGNLILVRRFL